MKEKGKKNHLLVTDFGIIMSLRSENYKALNKYFFIFVFISSELLILVYSLIVLFFFKKKHLDI